MAQFISLLRGINVSGQKKILMAELRDMFGTLGFENVRSYLQSGNVIFDASETDTDLLSDRIEAGIKETFTFDVPTLVRDASYFKEVIANNPFQGQTVQDAKLPYVAFLDRVPQENSKDLKVPEGEAAHFILDERCIYINYPNGAGRSKLTTNFFERHLKVTATARNWRTVLALYEMTQK